MSASAQFEYRDPILSLGSSVTSIVLSASTALTQVFEIKR